MHGAYVSKKNKTKTNQKPAEGQRYQFKLLAPKEYVIVVNQLENVYRFKFKMSGVGERET